MYYTIKADGEPVAKTDSAHIASRIAVMYKPKVEIKIIDTCYNRIAFNSKRTVWTSEVVYKSICEKSLQFKADYTKKMDSQS